MIGWAIVRAVKANPALNHAFAKNAAGELFRVVKKDINFGLAVDVPARTARAVSSSPALRIGRDRFRRLHGRV